MIVQPSAILSQLASGPKTYTQLWETFGNGFYAHIPRLIEEGKIREEKLENGSKYHLVERKK